MSSPYAQKGSSGGSVYAQKGTSTGSVYASRGGGGSAAPKKHRGGFLGALEQGAHWTAGKVGLAAHDVKAIPGGMYQLAKAVETDELHGLRHGDVNPITAVGLGKHTLPLEKGMAVGAVQSVEHPGRDPFQTVLTVLPLLTGGASVAARAGAVGRAAGESSTLGDLAKAAAAKPAVKPRLVTVGDTQVSLHPSANPAVRAAQGLHDKVIQRGIDRNPEGRVASYGTKRVGGSLAETARYQQRLRDVPSQLLERSAKKLGATKGRQRVEQAALELTSVNTTPEKASAYHLSQAEKGVEPAMNRAVAKLYKAVADRGLLTQNEHGDVVVNAADHPKLAQADVQLANVQGRGDAILARYGVRTPQELQAAVNAPGRYRAGATYISPAKAAAREREALRTGVAEENAVNKLHAIAEKTRTREERALAKREERTLGDQFAAATGRTAVERQAIREAAPVNQHAAAASRARAALADQVDQTIRRVERLHESVTHGLVQHAEGKPVAPALARIKRLRVAEKELTGLRQQARRLRREGGEIAQQQQLHSGALQHAENTAAAEYEQIANELTAVRKARAGVDDRSFESRQALEQRVAKIRERAQQNIDRARQEVGIVGGETARPGRGHVSYAGSEPKAPKSATASAASPVVGEARAPITSHANEGINISKGVVPNDVTGQAARHLRQIVRFVNTTEHRNQAIRTGSNVRRTSRDVLVKIPGAEHAKIPAAVNEILGKTKVTHDDVAGINAALTAYREDMVPGLRDRFAADKQAGIGTPAPEGHRWVDQNILGDLAKPAAGPRGRVARTADTINSAVTAATVYFKIGHVGTRVLTNASTNIIQGSARPGQIAKSVELWKTLPDEDRLRALAASGQHGFQSMPHEGQNLVGRAAGRGANWWAKHADAVFRFNSIAYEARRAGFDTPAKFHDLLDRLERPQDFNMTAAEHAKIDFVAKRANREGIAYDRLSEAERRFLTRAVWFYPWLRGTVGFAGNTLLEHPFKSAALAAAGVQGRKTQERELGDVPSYEGGLFKLGGPADRPLVADFSTFSPFATPADIAEAVARPGQLSGFLNPAATAGTNLIFGLDQYGGKSTSPIEDALTSLTAPTPEAQILTAYMQRHKDQSKRQFPKSPKLAGTRDPLLRALLGPGTPRRLNPPAAHSAAARERSGR